MADSFETIIARMRAEVRGEIQGPETLQGMISLFERYRRAVRLAEYNLTGLNPRNPRDKFRFGERLQAEADALATSFPRFPEALRKMQS